MGAQGSTEQGAPPPLVDENAIVGPEGGGRVRQVKIAGAGHPDVNGTCTLANDFAGAEMFEKFPGRGSSLGKLFIRRQSPDRLDTWVISLGLDAHSGCDDLFKREAGRKPAAAPVLPRAVERQAAVEASRSGVSQGGASVAAPRGVYHRRDGSPRHEGDRVCLYLRCARQERSHRVLCSIPLESCGVEVQGSNAELGAGR